MDLFSLFDSSMSTVDLVQSFAMLSWMSTGDSDMLQKVLTARVGLEVYRRLSGDQEIDMLRNQTIMAIVKYVQDNPKAKKEDLQKVISKHIFDFANKLNHM